MKKFIKFLRSVLFSALIVVAMCLSGCGKDTAYYVSAESQETEHIENSQVELPVEQLENTEAELHLLYVYVCGEIQNPGVYQMQEDSRICDLFEAAGGLTEDASREYWNQARLLTDGEMIYVPTQEEAEERQNQEDTTLSMENNSDTDKININTASKEQLMTLPGIGEAKAAAILNYREEHGAFTSIEELKQVEGIKDGVYTKMEQYVVVN